MRITNQLTTHARTIVRAGTFTLIAVLISLPAFAQDVTKSDEGVYRIEVKDGKVLINGDVVTELADKEARVFFSRNGENEFVFFSEDGDVPFRNYTVRTPRPDRLGRLYEDIDWLEGEDRAGIRTFNIQRNLEPLREEMWDIRADAMAPLVALFEQNEEIRELEHRSQTIARQIRRGEGDETEGLEQELEEVLGQIFDMKLAEQRKRIDKMSGELDDLQQRLQERTSSRERIIERRLRELKGERDTLDW